LALAGVAGACYHATFGDIDGVGQRVADALRHEAIETTPGLSFHEQDKRIDATLLEIAELLPEFIDPSLREIVERIKKENKDDFKDPRFLHRWITFRNSREWLSVLVEEGPIRDSGFAALDAFGACQGQLQVAPAAVHPIREALSSRYSRVREMAAEMILLLATRFEPARNVIVESLSDPDEHVRFSMISHFQFYRMPFSPDFIRQVLERSLKDKSARNRTMAVQGCNTYMREDLLPELEKMLHADKSSKVLESIKYHLPLMQKGYSVDRRGRNRLAYGSDEAWREHATDFRR